jgi:DNA-binding NtrC family response regulator
MTTAIKTRPRILIIDDDRAFRVGTGALLVDEGYEVDAASGGDEGLARLSDGGYELVLLDLKMEGRTGLSVLEEIRRSGNPVPVLMLTGFATVDSAVQALKLGADDYITKPCDNHALRSKIRVILARRAPILGEGTSRIVAEAPEMAGVLRSIARVAPTESTVLLRGATGTGKELVARAIHEESTRRNRPFVAVNCSALAEGLLESELFGHARGAFTGAVSERKGVFEEANGGTIFLDEVGELPIEQQPKLLRALESREIRRVGSNAHRKVDVRIIAATNRDLRREVNEGRFRADLYFRLAVLRIALPPLRERGDDLPALTKQLLQSMGASDDAIQALCTPEQFASLGRGAWPGNVRELRNHLERCLAFEEALPVFEAAATTSWQTADASVPYAEARRRTLAAFEHAYVRALLARNDGKVMRAATAAGIDRVYLYKLMKRHR